jgi:RNA polymerase sigma-70 factor (ECF subfamily)
VSPAVTRPGPDLASVFDDHFGYVWKSLRRLGIADRDLEDLAHEVFLRVHERLHEYDPARPMRPWLFAFAYRVAAEHRRQACHRVEVVGLATEAPDPRPRADERLVDAERRALFRAALERLDVDRRAVLVLHHVDGVPVADIAHALGIPVNTAYSRLRLAREQLACAVKALSKRQVHRE